MNTFSRFSLISILLIMIKPVWAANPVIPALNAKREMDESFRLIRNYSCAAAIPKLDRVYWADRTYSNLALFYIIYCQDQLGQLAKAQANIQYLNQTLLSDKNREIIAKIQNKKLEAPVIKSNFYNVTPLFGGVNFPSSMYYNSGYFIGVTGSWADFVRQLSFSYSRLKLNRVANAEFTQDQYLLSYGQELGSNLSAKISYVKISNNDSLTNLGWVGGGSMNVHDQYRDIALFPEFYFSNYPGYSNNGLKVYQGSLGVAMHLKEFGLPRLYFSLKGIWIRTSNQTIVINPPFNQNLVSGEMGLKGYFFPVAAGISAWSGRQFFSVQSEGANITNVAFARNWGSKVDASITLDPNFSFGVFCSLEGIDEIVRQAKSIAGGGFFNVSF